VSVFGEQLQERLNTLLGKRLASGLTLTGWRFDLHETEDLEVGVKNNKIGGPYTAPGLKQESSGEICLHWEDEKYTIARIERRVLEDFQAHLELWEKTAYKDPYGPELVKPYEPPAVPLAHEGATAILNGEFTPAFTYLAEGLEIMTGYGINKVDGRVKISRDRRLVANSEGLWVAYEQTPVQIYLGGDDLFGDVFAEKRLPDQEEFTGLAAYAGRTVRELKKRATLPREGEMAVILTPSVFEAFLEHYLLSNLSGRLVANRQSAFAAQDFQEAKKVFREDLTISVDGTRPYRYSSYRCTGEGVPTGRADLVREGRLVTPVLTLKYAKKLGMEPTAIPVAGGYGLVIDLPQRESFDGFLGELEEGLIVYSVLGLHTQDYSAGKFSLVADQSLLVRKGQIQGKVETVIAGDFWQVLASEDTVFLDYPREETPAVCFRAHVAQ
jgi:PmbA protein